MEEKFNAAQLNAVLIQTKLNVDTSLSHVVARCAKIVSLLLEQRVKTAPYLFRKSLLLKTNSAMKNQ